MSTPVRVFIGSGEASLIERKVLTHTLKKHCSRPLELYVFNGTHNAIEHNDEPPVLAPLSLDLKYRSYTEFSLYRYLIPQICGYQGRAIHLDSDILCLGDIAELFDLPMGDNAMLAVSEYGDSSWATSVTLMDCSRVRFDLPEIYREVDAGKYSYSDFSRLSPAFLAVHPIKIGPLDKRWNSFDYYDSQTKILHYTDLLSQPWKFPGHTYGPLWFKYFEEARVAGEITDADINKTISRGYIRPDIRCGNRFTVGGWLKRGPLSRLFGASH